MSRFKTVKKEFASLPNAVIQGFYLTANELAVLITCLSYPNDWTYRPTHIWKNLGLSRNKTYDAFQGLVEKGHCIRITHKKGNLRAEVDYIFFDEIATCKKFVEENQQQLDSDVSADHMWDLKKCSRYSKNRDTEAGDSNSREVLKKKGKQKEEQQQETAAVPPKKIPRKQIKKPEKVYGILSDVDIPDLDKQEICKRYDEETVSYAIAWATHPDTTLNKGLVQAIKWACSKKPSMPVSKVDCEKENRKAAEELDGKLNKPKTMKIQCLSDCVEFTPLGEGRPMSIEYSCKGFKDQIFNALKKNKFVG